MNPWLPTAPCTPGTCAGHDGRVRGRPAATALLLAGCLWIMAGALGAPFVAVLGAARRERLIRCWAYGVVRAFGVRVRITGTPAGPGTAPGAAGTLVVANHISWLDIPLVAAVFPGRMLAKSEIRGWPLLGPLAARGGTLFVERDRLRALPTTVRTIGSALRGGSRVVVFPEGTTWCGRGSGGRFAPAAFQAAIDAGATVRPVRLSYRVEPPRTTGTTGRTGPVRGCRPAGRESTAPAGAAAFVGDDPLIASLWRVVTAAGLTAEIRVLPQIPAAGRPDRRDLARRAQTTVANESANRPPESVHH
ncbi:1-acyl-sn-glycerol-3-phosphate acyltransferase [Streptomyces sp. NBC_00257]|uniref:lysophospholipid acyltransferase family protein n=1 Tax=unclassified Streptomyces TaxID=2593676 RepID=UPI00224FCD45|nr:MULTISPECIES: lysophospholipid acyltransferase family protein [unclassified Streptomyces]WTB58665.1 1-acyl-sn-glycerol-3-phosphate acyltransferase [Streptomyces sp. NBC_00826]WTH88458.1 1-acyl-sn-glycerol-3-phosphate acyltransferase [Streptomyces sp. NBC_00825]WTH97187.1 1-acyl-sn-glycerol-3-phosphate acyltransferase [Streptomyces sp. NBC_00822]MCX4862687.1 1-acyl-sn-glycerol-3-phosphate acyltransferase [Streptomyces sp. NBC_00906]MCX4893924.1 1-acyl-sn-glycerol-3-phosphate acyltransferase 